MKLCVVTGSRAEFGLMQSMLQMFNDDPEIELYLVVTGAHLSPEFGSTVSFIEKTDLLIWKKIEIVLSSDTPVGVAKSMGVALLGFADAFAEINLDACMVLGDRYESFAAASAAAIFGLPLLHIHGGEVTEGSVDEMFRHSISKMAQLHFVACSEYKKRLLQLGECEATIFNVGALGLDGVDLCYRPVEALKTCLPELVNIIDQDFILVTFHPVTKGASDFGLSVFDNLLKALDSFPNLAVIFTFANADSGGRLINYRILDYIDKRDDCRALPSIGRENYLSLMKLSRGLVGNSSSGIFEAPNVGVRSLDLGIRQRGRLAAKSVARVLDTSVEQIKTDLASMLQENDGQDAEIFDNPFWAGGAAGQIKDILLSTPLVKFQSKRFNDLEF